MAGARDLVRPCGGELWALAAEKRGKKKKKKCPSSPPVLNAPPFSGWAGGLLTSTGAQSSLAEGPLLCTFAEHRSLGWALSSLDSGLVCGVWMWPRAGSLYCCSNFAQQDQKHFLGYCAFCGVQEVPEPLACGRCWARTGFAPGWEPQRPPPLGRWLQAGLQPATLKQRLSPRQLCFQLEKLSHGKHLGRAG